MNRVLFEVSYIGSWRTYFIIIIALCIFSFLYFRFRGIDRTDQSEKGRKIAGVITKVLRIFIVIYVFFLIKGYMDIVIQYKMGHYVEIEGTVDSYCYFKNSEYITLDGVKFHCSSGNQWGYYPVGRNFSVIAGNGQHLRIRYIPRGRENIIVYIEQILPEEWDSQ